MKTTLLKTLLATSLLTGVAACGGGGGGGGGSDVIIEPAINGVSTQTLQSRTGAANNETVQFSDAVVISGDGSGGTYVGQRDGQVRFTNTANGQPGVQGTFDVNGDGVIGGPNQTQDSDQFTVFNPENNPVQQETGEERVQFSTGTAGGEAYRRAADVPNFSDQTIVYVPKDEAQKMYAGMYTRTLQANQNSAGQTGIWGRETTNAQMDALTQGQSGTLTYDGFSQATMSRTVQGNGGTFDEGGFYEGSASATVDLGNNTLAAQANLDRQNGASGPDQIVMTTNGTFNADGSYNQSANFNGLLPGQTVTGSANGEFFGPNGETIGMTFHGDAPNANIAGGLIVNKNGD